MYENRKVEWISGDPLPGYGDQLGLPFSIPRPSQHLILKHISRLVIKHLVFFAYRWECKCLLQDIKCYLRGLTFCVFYILKLCSRKLKKIFFWFLLSFRPQSETLLSHSDMFCTLIRLHPGGWRWKHFRWISSAVYFWRCQTLRIHDWCQLPLPLAASVCLHVQL